MIDNGLENYAERLRSLSVFRGILADKTIERFSALLSQPNADTYGGFAYSLYEHTDCLTDYILEAVTEDENPFMLRLAACEEVPECVEAAAKDELKTLEELSRITPSEIRAAMGKEALYARAEWKCRDCDFTRAYTERMAGLSTRGYGIFSKYHVFVLKNGVITPVKNPDPQRLSQLSGYELERERVIANTLALLNDKPAANVLLYGDAGTGKSSTVKAVANEYSGKGLRLIELSKGQLPELPSIIEKIAKNPLKFIIFIDDVSFSSDDDNFGFLKAVLEGSVSTKTPNLAIYATSNRRHLVKEKFSDREGDDIHVSDTREELMSLSERFGLKVAFLKPDKEVYLSIVAMLARESGILCDEALLNRAEVFALRRNGRSGRAAKQFIESVLAEM